MDFGAIGGTVGMIAGEVVARRIPFVGRFVGAAVGQTLGAALGGASAEKAIFQGLVTGGGVAILGGAVGALAKRGELVAAGKLGVMGAARGPVRERVFQALTKDAVVGSPFAIRVGQTVGGASAISSANSYFDYLARDRHGVWIGGYGDGLAKEIPQSGGQGFLFRPAVMPESIWPWYDELAKLLVHIWQSFGVPGQKTVVPEIALPDSVANVPVASGVFGLSYQAYADQLENSLGKFIELENLISRVITYCDVSSAAARGSIVYLVKQINGQILLGKGDHAEYYHAIESAIAHADSVVREAVRRSGVANNNICVTTAQLPPGQQRPPPVQPEYELPLPTKSGN